MYEKAIEARKRLEGENSLNYALVLAMAAGSYRDTGNFAKADEYLKESYLKIAMEFGEDNVSNAVILNCMGLNYKKQKKYERAIDAYERALKIRDEQMGEEHPDSIATRHNIGEVYLEWGKEDKAKEMFDKNVEILKKAENKGNDKLHNKEQNFF